MLQGPPGPNLNELERARRVLTPCTLVIEFTTDGALAPSVLWAGYRPSTSPPIEGRGWESSLRNKAPNHRHFFRPAFSGRTIHEQARLRHSKSPTAEGRIGLDVSPICSYRVVTKLTEPIVGF